MKALHIEGTKDKPEVHFDPSTGTLAMGGSSLPENVLEVFYPIIWSIEEYKHECAKTTNVEFNFEYLNTASSHMVSKIIAAIYDLRNKSNIHINWYYAKDDLEMKELGEDLLYEMDFGYTICEVPKKISLPW